MYDDKRKELLTIQNDITSGQFDVRIMSGSTMPSNKYAEYQMYMEAYQLGLIDKVEALKKTEIYDKEGVLQRTGEVQRLQSIIGQLQDQIKEISGDLQTAQRESVSDRKRVEVEKFKSKLNKSQVGTDAQLKIEAERLKQKQNQEVQSSFDNFQNPDIVLDE